ncbi:hypothetical protein NDU88_009074 [Pleurodeles waltl]|uniref:Uncharacterized protein n=1 Tax=Pleurodeles waltl TaxID=8319 RepID=A0AAV7PS94_PLEWA|nr:hypothetical protein NDU88_009074 [Pleurodeles waltl]
MQVRDRILTWEPSWTETLEPGMEACREDSSCWRRAALEVRKVWNLTSRVMLREVSGGNTGIDSTGEETTRCRQKEMAPVIKGGPSSLGQQEGDLVCIYIQR